MSLQSDYHLERSRLETHKLTIGAIEYAFCVFSPQRLTCANINEAGLICYDVINNGFICPGIVFIRQEETRDQIKHAARQVKEESMFLFESKRVNNSSCSQRDINHLILPVSIHSQHSFIQSL